MTGSVIQLAMNFGYPGSYSRMPDDVVANKPVDSDSAAIPFGAAVRLTTGNKFTLGDASLTADNFAGIAVREVKQAITLNADQGSYAALDPCDVLLRGNTVIKLARGSATAGGAVLFRIADGTATKATNTYVGPIAAGNVVVIGDTSYTCGDGTGGSTTAANIAAAAVTAGGEGSYEDGVLSIEFEAASAGAAGSATALDVYASAGPAVGEVVRVAGVDAVSGAKVGEFEAGSAVAGKTIELPGVKFTTGEVDGNGIVEISITKRNNN